MDILWIADHPDKNPDAKIWITKITFLVLMAALRPWLTPDGYFLDTELSRSKYQDIT